MQSSSASRSLVSSKSSRQSRTETPERKPKKKRGGKKSRREKKRLQRVKGKSLEKSGKFIVSSLQRNVTNLKNWQSASLTDKPDDHQHLWTTELKKLADRGFKRGKFALFAS